ncbi:MAG: 16S rRNA (guanine(966)-N(2))-methyltransferase RsmD [Chthoniobacterales bacterium]
MRIIAGSASGLSIKTPPSGVRPTMDRVRAAIFSSLGEKVPGAKVLDLCSGSGALGIEALSRGSEKAEFVEHNRQAAECIRQNLRSTGLEGKVHEMDVFKFLKLYAQHDHYDLIFADPPYDKTQSLPSVAERLINEEGALSCLAPEGIFILEKNARIACTIPASWQQLRSKRYGETEVLYLSRA